MQNVHCLPHRIMLEIDDNARDAMIAALARSNLSLNNTYSQGSCFSTVGGSLSMVLNTGSSLGN